jgi:hypothetical protein
MTDRERLRALVDDLPEKKVYVALRFVENLQESEPDPVLVALRDAPVDDEPLTDEDLTALAESREDVARGRLTSDEEIRQRFLGDH